MPGQFSFKKVDNSCINKLKIIGLLTSPCRVSMLHEKDLEVLLTTRKLDFRCEYIDNKTSNIFP